MRLVLPPIEVLTFLAAVSGRAATLKSGWSTTSNARRELLISDAIGCKKNIQRSFSQIDAFLTLVNQVVP